MLSVFVNQISNRKLNETGMNDTSNFESYVSRPACSSEGTSPLYVLLLVYITT